MTTLAIGHLIANALIGITLPCLLAFTAWAMGAFK